MTAVVPQGVAAERSRPRALQRESARASIGTTTTRPAANGLRQGAGRMVRQLTELASLISVEAACPSSSKTSEIRPQVFVPEPLRICWQWREDGGHEGVQLWLGADREFLAHLPKIIGFLRRSLDAQGVQLCSLVCNGKERLGTSAMRARKSAEPTVSGRPQSAGAQSLHDMAYVV